MKYILRNYVEVAYLVNHPIANKSTFISRFELSKYEYTLDLDRIFALSSQYGIRITENGKQLITEIINEEIYNRVSKPLYVFYCNYSVDYKDVLVEAKILLELLSDSNEYLSVVDLEEKLGYTKSNFRTPLKNVRELLQSYQIVSKSKPYYGLFIEGDEMSIRRVYISIYNTFEKRIFTELYGSSIGNDDYTDLYFLFKSVCYANNLSFTGFDSHNICLYLFVLRERVGANHFIDKLDVDDKLLYEIRNNARLLQIAKEILVKLHIPLNEYEIISLAIVLLTYRIDEKFSKEIVKKYYCDEYENLVYIIYSMLENKFNLNVRGTKYDEIVLSNINDLVLYHHLSILKNRSLRVTRINGFTASYPLVNYIGKCLNQVISDFYGYPVDEDYSNMVSNCISYYIDTIDYQVDGLKIVVIDRNGQFFAEETRERLICELDKSLYQCIDIKDHYEILDQLNANTNSYDLVVSNQRILIKSSVCASMLEHRNSVKSLEKTIRSMRKACSYIFKNGLQLVHQDVTDFSWLEKQAKNCCVIKQSVVVFECHEKKESVLQFGKVESNVSMEDKHIRNYIILKTNLKTVNLRLISILLHEMVFNNELMDALAIHQDVALIDKYLNERLK